MYEPGTVMIRERDTSAYVLALLSGWAVVSVGTERGTRLILALRGAGEVVGDLAAVDRGPRSATVTALGRVRAVAVSGDRFRRFLAARPHATSLIMQQLSARLRSADVERRSLASETVLQRLAARLAELAERAGRPGPRGTVLEIPLPQQDWPPPSARPARPSPRPCACCANGASSAPPRAGSSSPTWRNSSASPRAADPARRDPRRNLRRVCKRPHRPPRRTARLVPSPRAPRHITAPRESE